MSLFKEGFLQDTLDIAKKMRSDTVTLSDGVRVEVIDHGFVLVEPAEISSSTKHIVVSAGVHGDETGPMELVNNVVADIETQKLKVKHRLLFFFGHPQATLSHSRFVIENLNRLFDAVPSHTNVETEIATNIKRHIDQFFAGTDQSQRWHFDLHCAIRGSKHYTFAVSPKTQKPTRSKALFEFINASQLEAVLLSNSPSPTCSWYSAHNHSAQALTVELGRVAPLWNNDLNKIAPFDRALRAMISDNVLPDAEHAAITYRVNRTITRHYEDFQFNFADDVENFTSFSLGDVLGHDGEQILMTKVANEAVVFPNPKVALGQRAALMVCPVVTRLENDQVVYDA